MRLELTRSIIREWKKTDITSLVRHANDRAVWRNLMDRFPHPYTRADALDWLRYLASEKPPGNFAIEGDGEADGGIRVRIGHDLYMRSREKLHRTRPPYHWER